MVYLRDRMVFIHPDARSVQGMNGITPTGEVSLW